MELFERPPGGEPAGASVRRLREFAYSCNEAPRDAQ